MKPVAVLIAVLALAGCATKIAPEAAKVRTVSGPEIQSCESLGLIQADRQIGDDKENETSIMNDVRNEVAKRGGNGVFIMSTGSRGFYGATITAQALKCKD